jgi:insulysin
VQWENEPWYGTAYRVERFDEEFVKQVNDGLVPCHLINNSFAKQANGMNDIAEIHLPGPNDFIPTNLDVDKREVAKVRIDLLLHPNFLSCSHYL